MEDILLDDERIDEVNENLRIIQKKNGLTFGTDAYFLSAFAKADRKGECADLGSGTGIISLLCQSRNKFAKVFAVEIQKSFFDIIGRNCEINGLSDRIVPVHSDIREITGIKKESLSAVISNPPYTKVEDGKRPESDEMNIARREENGDIFDFCRVASELLKFGGMFYTVYRADRCPDLFYAMKQNKIEPKRCVMIYPDADSKPSLILTEGKKGASASLQYSRPLFIYKKETDGVRSFSEDYNRIYETFSLDFLFNKR